MRIITYLLSLITLCACEKQAVELNESQTTLISFSVECPEMETSTRILNPSGESVVKDLNIYLFHKNTDISKHLYITSSTNLFSVNLVLGEYEMFVIANLGANTGKISRDAVANYQSTISTQAQIESKGSLLMSSHQSVTIKGATNIPVTLTRKIAKVDFNLSVAPSFSSNFTLSTIQVRSAAGGVKLFDKSASTNVFDYEPSSALTKFYLFENAQGINHSITSQQQKSRKNAPRNATYIHIQGYSAGKKVEYAIYLGENNTSDFNVYGNKHYVINATISSTSEIDYRISTSDLTVANFSSEYKPGETAHGTLNLSSKNNYDNSFRLSYRILEGGGTVRINGVNYSPNTPFNFLGTGEQTKSAQVAYIQNSSSGVRIKFTATDRYGFTLDKDMWTTYSQPRTVDVTLEYEEKSDCSVHMRAVASDVVSSDIYIDCEIALYWITWGDAKRRGTTMSAKILIPKGAKIGAYHRFFAGPPTYKGIEFDKYKSTSISKTVDSDGTKYNFIQP